MDSGIPVQKIPLFLYILTTMQKNTFFQELKRRNVYKVALTYAIVAWLILQIGSIVFPTINAPAWLMQALLFFLVIGFPIALILAWAFEMSPEGIIRTSSVAAEENPYSDAKKKPLTSNFFIGVLLFIVVGQFVYFNFFSNSSDITTDVIPEAIRSERIAVVPFENLTNDSSLDNMGKIAANFINMGLMDIDDAEVVSPATVLSSMSAFGILPNDPSGRTSFSELTGASNILSGNYYMEHESMIFALQVQDATTGQMRFAFPSISSDQGSKEEILTLLREQVLGYWAARELIETRRIKSPNYTAYELFLDMIGKFPDQVVLEKIISIDSTFYLPRIFFLNLNRARDIPEVNEQHFQFLDRHFDYLSSYEKSWLSFLKNLYLGNSIEAFNSINELRLKYPKDFLVNHESAVTAAEMLNNPELTLEIYQALDRDLFSTKEVGLYYYFRMFHEAHATFKLKGREAIIELLNSFQKQDDENEFMYSLNGLNISMLESNYEKFSNQAKVLCKSQYPLGRVYFFLQLFYKSTLCTEDMRSIIIEQLELRLGVEDPKDPSYANVHAWINLNKKIPLDDHFDYKIYKSDLPEWAYNDLLKIYCLSKIRAGNMDDISEAIKELADLDGPNYGISTLFGSGTAQYNLGVIYAALGEKDIAIQYLRKARNLGVPSWLCQFKYDQALTSLQDMPEFQELNEPIWPKILD